MLRSVFVKTIYLILIMTFLVGCSSLDHRIDGPRYVYNPTVYPGLQEDLAMIKVSTQGPKDWWMQEIWPLALTVAVVDLPFSLGFDTICLPYDLFPKPIKCANAYECRGIPCKEVLEADKCVYKRECILRECICTAACN